jgi:hypothetical protein
MPVSDRPDGRAREADRLVPDGGGRVRRAYVAPALIEYGTVAKLTQTGNGSVGDFSGMMRMMICL